jgi:hypothetical protein
MNNNQVRQTLNALADALESQEFGSILTDPTAFVQQIPKRSLSGDHIHGGKILKFASAGITDSATKEQIVVTDDSVSITSLSVGSVKSDLNVNGTVSAKVVKADVLEVKEIKADIKFEKGESVTFGGGDIYGKGLLWASVGYTKQLVFNSNPDRIFSSETIDVAKGKSFSVNGIKVLDDTELGPTVTKSHLREIGRLKGLLVDGDVVINQYMFYNSVSDRLGLGTDEPNAGISVVEEDTEMMLGGKGGRGIVGTFAGQGVDIVTDNTPRISISAGGAIQLGNPKTPPTQVSINGKLAIKVNSPDPEVDLHVNGAIKYGGRLQKYDKTYPDAGSYNSGDIVWNIDPKMNAYVGWVCIQTGSPGVWAPFGKIGNQ